MDNFKASQEAYTKSILEMMEDLEVIAELEEIIEEVWDEEYTTDAVA